MTSPSSHHVPVLVVEDDSGIRETLGTLLEDVGYAVAKTTTVADARAYLWTASTGHVVLLDFLLAGDSADILLREVERDTHLRRHQYILMPASPISRFPTEAQRLINACCTEVVYKPFDIDTLLAAVARAAARLPAS